MRRTKPNFENLELADLLKIAALVDVAVRVLFLRVPSAQHRGQKTFFVTRKRRTMLYSLPQLQE